MRWKADRSGAGENRFMSSGRKIASCAGATRPCQAVQAAKIGHHFPRCEPAVERGSPSKETPMWARTASGAATTSWPPTLRCRSWAEEWWRGGAGRWFCPRIDAEQPEDLPRLSAKIHLVHRPIFAAFSYREKAWSVWRVSITRHWLVCAENAHSRSTLASAVERVDAGR